MSEFLIDADLRFTLSLISDEVARFNRLQKADQRRYKTLKFLLRNEQLFGEWVEHFVRLILIFVLYSVIGNGLLAGLHTLNLAHSVDSADLALIYLLTTIVTAIVLRNRWRLAFRAGKMADLLNEEHSAEVAYRSQLARLTKWLTQVFENELDRWNETAAREPETTLAAIEGSFELLKQFNLQLPEPVALQVRELQRTINRQLA